MREASELGRRHVPGGVGTLCHVAPPPPRSSPRAVRTLPPRVASESLLTLRPPACAQVEKWEQQRESGTYPGPVPGESRGGGGH